MMMHLNDSWDLFQLFKAHSHTQLFLSRTYQQNRIEEYHTYSYQNSPAFIYHIESAELFYKQASHSPSMLKPILLFYGLVQLIKAAILTQDPLYPSSTTLLAHGVTTRKLKKQHYSFLRDEVKIQQKGLFGYMSEIMFHMKHLEKDKFMMGSLLGEIPEMAGSLEFFGLEKGFTLNKMSDCQYRCNHRVLDTFHMTAERFQEFLSTNYPFSIKVKETGKDKIELFFSAPFDPNTCSCLKYNLPSNTCYISRKNDFHSEQLSELMVHYLLLYNLSMIARYETEWWMDLHHTKPTEDYPLIEQFLGCTQLKSPYLVSEWLLKKGC
ncbi:YaaC family protein [Bacillus sp. 1P06AnD]|uniref:YaaC family protein n=1 Tax=Bacillus sp. 1P06AnD TaxID=3132208 RepID=UPI0039A3455E